MQLTSAYADHIPADLLERYEFREVRNASAVLRSVNAPLFEELVEVLREFFLTARDILLPGGNEGTVAKKLNGAFRELGWREARVDSSLTTTLVVFPYAKAGERKTTLVPSEPANFEGYKADWVKGRVAGDCEWNAKDGNLDRDLASYRSLYEAGYIDAAVLITRTQDDLRLLETELTTELLVMEPAIVAHALDTTDETIKKVRDRLLTEKTKGRLGTTTTTNIDRLTDRMKRGDAGGCPLLAVAISKNTWDGSRAIVGV